jgi:hypothetical protein
MGKEQKNINRLVRKLKRAVGIVEKCGTFCLSKMLVFSIFTFPNKSNNKWCCARWHRGHGVIVFILDFVNTVKEKPYFDKKTPQ